MTNDADTLATAPYATTGDMLKEHPGLAPWRPPAGITPRMGDAELVTLATMQAVPGYASRARWLRHARARLRRLFPCLPRQPGYNKRLRKAAGLMRSVNRIPAATTSAWSDDVRAVDSARWNAAAPARPSNAPTWQAGPARPGSSLPNGPARRKVVMRAGLTGR